MPGRSTWALERRLTQAACCTLGPLCVVGLAPLPPASFGNAPSAEARPCLHVTPTLGSSPSFPNLIDVFCTLPDPMHLSESLVSLSETERGVNVNTSEVTGYFRNMGAFPLSQTSVLGTAPTAVTPSWAAAPGSLTHHPRAAPFAQGALCPSPCAHRCGPGPRTASPRTPPGPRCYCFWRQPTRTIDPCVLTAQLGGGAVSTRRSSVHKTF